MSVSPAAKYGALPGVDFASSCSMLKAMTKHSHTLFLLILFLPCFLNAQDEGEFQSLFNGKDLTGWDGNPELWSVENGVITGKTNGPDHLSYNQFLIWRGGRLKNFELRVTARVKGENNSGIQYRSKELPEIGKWSVGGYQCDMHSNPPYNAMIYHERGRGILVQNGQSVIAGPNGGRWIVAEHDPVKVDDLSQWHEYRIRAEGNHITHWIDGKMTIELADHDEKNRALSGLLAFQVHRGPAMEVQIKDVRLKVLPDGGATPFAKANIPSDAQLIEKKPRPKGKGKSKGKSKNKSKAQPPKGKASGKGKSQAKTKAKARRPRRPTEVGPRIGENKATPVNRIKVPKDFAVELIYSVPGQLQGSWVALCHDDKGRIYASDQYGELYRFAPPPPGKTLAAPDIEKVPVKIRAINGMVYAFGALYAGVNDYEQKMTSGLYRITDSNNDDQLDKVELLRAFESKSDHGVHAVVPSPDGKSLYLITGNNAVLTEISPSSPVARVWGDDHLLPRMPDGRGHNRHVLAPGGIIYRVDPHGERFEAVASGFRNIYDASFNKDGELFTYDADMEYDFNTPWYRPTRVNHVVSGGEYGWRNGAGKYPEFYTDNLPATVNIGPGSPTGTLFGYGAKFPKKYQEALYVLDWSWGKIYAVHLQENGASYGGVKEEFITGAPLPVTDAIILPQEGAMYFAIGGRRVQSGLYRVTYQGGESAEPIDLTPRKSPARELRRRLEMFHGVADSAAADAVWPHLDHPDRYVRWAARAALEHQPIENWKERALIEKSSGKRLQALLALARAAGECPSHREAGFSPEAEVRDGILQSVTELNWASLKKWEKIALLRLTQIVLHRFGDPGSELRGRIVSQLEPQFPADSFDLNWLLCETLVHLQVPSTAAKGMKLIAESASQEPQMQFARSLRMLTTGWTPQLRRQQLEWFLKAANYRGGASFSKFIELIRMDSLTTFSEQESQVHAALIAKKPEQKSAIELAGAIFAGRTPKMWTLEELSAAASSGLRNRDFANGRKMFSAAACYTCHRFGNAGGMNGPDLTGSGGRYSPHDLLDAIINPSKEINEQFAPIVVTKNDGSVVTGVVVNLNGDNVTLNTDLSDPNQRVNIDRKTVKSIEVSKISPMPPMLLAMLTKEEILDLLAYVLSGGDRGNEMFATR